MAKILLIEDEPKVLQMYKSRFQESKHEVETALDGEEGLRKVDKFKPDIILLDILMPKMSGLEVLKKLKADSTTINIPVILLTNVGTSEDDINIGLEWGAIAYLIKASYTSKEVKEKVEEILAACLHKKGEKIPKTKVTIKKESFYDD